MKPHIKIYFEFFSYDPGDFIPCEICGDKAVDIHHIQCRGMGGTTKKDSIVNLQALCRNCHIKYGDKKDYIDMLQNKHKEVMEKFNPKQTAIIYNKL